MPNIVQNESEINHYSSVAEEEERDGDDDNTSAC